MTTHSAQDAFHIPLLSKGVITENMQRYGFTNECWRVSFLDENHIFMREMVMRGGVHFISGAPGFEIQVKSCECGNGSNPIGQGHSHWCCLFRREF